MLRIISAADNSVTLSHKTRLHTILETVYNIAEADLWKESYARIAPEDFQQLIKQEEILIAYYNDEVVGGIHSYQIANHLFGFGMLCVDFDKKGLGIGRALIERAEKNAMELGGKEMRLEILRPKGIKNAFKERIREWYERMGYSYTHSQNFAEIKPVKAENLRRPSDFDYYVKVLKC